MGTKKPRVRFKKLRSRSQKIKAKMKTEMYVGDPMKDLEMRNKELKEKLEDALRERDSLQRRTDSLERIIRIEIK